MTSTVLDVSVLLLCLSAGVVLITGVDHTPNSSAPTATDVADRLTTETVTVTYEPRDGPTDRRTVHATPAELLAMQVTAAETRSGENSDRAAGFVSRSQSVVAAGLRPRTRIDVRRVSSESKAPSVEWITEVAARASTQGQFPVRDMRTPAGEAISDRVSHRPNTGAKPRWNHAERETDSRKANDRVSTVVAIGPEPPRRVDSTSAIVRHPTPPASSATEIQIVVRRW